MASPPPVIPITADCGSHMCDPYSAGPPVSARHQANTERGCTGLLRSYEFSSELLAAMIEGVQDKKGTLDEFYIRFAQMEKSHKEQIKNRFLRVLRELTLIFDSSLHISETRFRQKADFYSLFLVIDEFVSSGKTVKGKDLSFLREDLSILQYNIRPESEVNICREYAIKCVSQANSASSRRWRNSFLKPILRGTYIGLHGSDIDGAQLLYKLSDELDQGGGICPDPVFECPICEIEISADFSECVIAWHRLSDVKQIANSIWIHSTCIDEHQTEWLPLERPNDHDQPNLL